MEEAGNKQTGKYLSGYKKCYGITQDKGDGDGQELGRRAEKASLMSCEQRLKVCGGEPHSAREIGSTTSLNVC